MSTYKEKVNLLLNDKATSNWLKKELRLIDGRDVLDYLNDIEMLHNLLTLKFNAMVAK